MKGRCSAAPLRTFANGKDSGIGVQKSLLLEVIQKSIR